MVSIESIREQFDELGIEPSDEVVNKCKYSEKIASNWRLSAGQMVLVEFHTFLINFPIILYWSYSYYRYWNLYQQRYHRSSRVRGTMDGLQCVEIEWCRTNGSLSKRDGSPRIHEQSTEANESIEHCCHQREHRYVSTNGFQSVQNNNLSQCGFSRARCVGNVRLYYSQGELHFDNVLLCFMPYLTTIPLQSLQQLLAFSQVLTRWLLCWNPQFSN